jgi:1-phosphatidylinositol-3-phosphate 5-kinase
MQSFLDVLPEYFKYMASIAFDGVDSVLSKTIGLYHTTILNRETGHKQHHYIAVLENVFYGKQVDQIYDLKGSSRNRYVKKNKHSSLPTTNNYETAERSLKEETKMATYPTNTLVDTFFPEKKKEESNIEKVQTQNKEPKLEKPVLLDGNFLEYTTGYPLGIDMKDHKKFLKAIKNDTAFLSSINIVDYSMIVGFDYNGKNENDRNPFNMTVGIIDYLRQFDFMKRMESVGKSVGMIAGQASPTIIEPALYSKRFVEAMQRYFMPVASMSLMKEKDKQTTI